MKSGIAPRDAATRRGVYKSEEGRAAVESYYRKALDSYTQIPLKRFHVPTPPGRTHIVGCGDPSKPPLILLHGSMANSATWLGMIPEFATSFSLYCVDIPGEPGLSEPVRMPLNSSQPADWLGSVLDGLGLKSAALLGMSLGGFYALSFAAAYPERVSALSLLVPGGIAAQKSSFLPKMMFFMLLGERGRALMNKAIYYNTEVPEEIHDFQALVTANFTPLTEPIPIFSDDELRRLTMPIQYFGGVHDALLDTRATARRLSALLPQAEIHVLEDKGHVIIDRGTEIAAFLARHLPES